MKVFKKKESPTSRARVVICDDQADVRKALRRGLERDPRFEIAGEASDGQEVRDVIAAEQPDALLLDFGMPGTTGVEVLRSLRSDFPDLKIAVISGFAEMGPEAVDMGADVFLSKPVHPRDLINALGTALWPRAASAKPAAAGSR